MNFDDESYIDLNQDVNELDISESKIENKTLRMQELITQFEYRLKGYMWKSNGEKYYYTGDALLGEKTIQEVMLLLYPFSREINMISNKTSHGWEVQKLRTRITLAKILFYAHDSNAQKFDIVWRSFSNLLTNIGDIIVGKNSQGYLKSLFTKDNEDDYYPDYNTRKRKKYDDGEMI